jgi:hypothetical protein
MGSDILIRTKGWSTPRARFYTQIDTVNRVLGLSFPPQQPALGGIKKYVESLQKNPRVVQEFYTLEQLWVVLGAWSAKLLQEKNKSQNQDAFFNCLESYNVLLQKKFYDQSVLDIIFSKIYDPKLAWPEMKDHEQTAKDALQMAFNQLQMFFSDLEIKKKLLSMDLQLLKGLSVPTCQQYFAPNVLVQILSEQTKEQQLRVLKTQQHWFSEAHWIVLLTNFGKQWFETEVKKYLPLKKLQEIVEKLPFNATNKALITLILSDSNMRGNLNVSGASLLRWAEQSYYHSEICQLVGQGREFYEKSQHSKELIQKAKEKSIYLKASLELHQSIEKASGGFFNSLGKKRENYVRAFIQKEPLDQAICAVIAKDSRCFQHLAIAPSHNGFLGFFRRTQKQVEQEKETLARKSPFFAAVLYQESLATVLEKRKWWPQEQLLTWLETFFCEENAEAAAVREALLKRLLPDFLVADKAHSWELTSWEKFCIWSSKVKSEYEAKKEGSDMYYGTRLRLGAQLTLAHGAERLRLEQAKLKQNSILPNKTASATSKQENNVVEAKEIQEENFTPTEWDYLLLAKICGFFNLNIAEITSEKLIKAYQEAAQQKPLFMAKDSWNWLQQVLEEFKKKLPEKSARITAEQIKDFQQRGSEWRCSWDHSCGLGKELVQYRAKHKSGERTKAQQALYDFGYQQAWLGLGQAPSSKTLNSEKTKEIKNIFLLKYASDKNVDEIKASTSVREKVRARFEGKDDALSAEEKRQNERWHEIVRNILGSADPEPEKIKSAIYAKILQEKKKVTVFKKLETTLDNLNPSDREWFYAGFEEGQEDLKFAEDHLAIWTKILGSKIADEKIENMKRELEQANRIIKEKDAQIQQREEEEKAAQEKIKAFQEETKAAQKKTKEAWEEIQTILKKEKQAQEVLRQIAANPALAPTLLAQFAASEEPAKEVAVSVAAPIASVAAADSRLFQAATSPAASQVAEKAQTEQQKQSDSVDPSKISGGKQGADSSRSQPDNTSTATMEL